jgi:ferritin
VEVLLSFYENPENQKIRPDIFQEALEEARRVELLDDLLSFFQNPENQPKINESFVSAERSTFSISDKNLRVEFLHQILRYLTNNESLALISLSPIEDLPLLITGVNLGIDPFVIQSWNLSEEERESLLPIFISLANKGIKFDFPFPYSPREELKRTRKLNEMIIEYFKTLDFILSLPEEFRKADLIQNHFRNIKQIIKKYKIKQTTLDISYGFLREILTEIKGLEKRIIEKIKELLKISQDIEDKKIFNFIKECTYFPVIFTLTSHYSKIYRNGLPLLGKITSSLIKDPTLRDYFQMRYDLSDPITREQLNPLLEGKSPEEYPQIIEKWRNPYYTFKILSQEEREKIETAEIDWDQVWEHIKSQTYGDKHYEQLFGLEEFKNLEEENKNKIREIIKTIFSPDKKTINFGELREILQEKLNEKKINILIGYLQLLRDISLKQKTLQEILSTIERLNKNIQQNWQEFGQLIMWQQDIYNYLTQLIKEQEKERKIIRKQTILLSYLTDHPKTLFEIGKYPVSTCQNYESTGSLNTKLLGYVFDAHIKALVLREIELETEEEINEEDLNQAKVEIDEEKGTIIITLPNGKTVEGRISKPIARRIIMLGKKERQRFY